MKSYYVNVLKRVENAGVKAWLVGASARMVEMGVQPDIITLAVDTPDLKNIAPAVNSAILDDQGSFQVLRGNIDGLPVRAFKLQGDSIEEDLARRDLSVEAIAFRSDGGVVDPFGGRRDIRNCVLRLTGDDVNLINKDPHRIVRMLRLAAELDMDIFWKSDADVREFLRFNAKRMADVPVERWGREIMKGLRSRPYRFIRLCDTYGLLPFFLKDLDDLKRVADKDNTTLFEHTLRVLSVVEDRLAAYKVNNIDALVLAALFCYIGMREPSERDLDLTNKLTEAYLSSWNVPSDVIEVVNIVINRYGHFYKLRTEEDLCDSVLRLSRSTVHTGLEFAICIALAEALPFRDVLEENSWRLAQVLRRFRAIRRQQDGARRWLSGDDIMKLTGMKPGPQVGELLKRLDVAVGTGKVSSRERAEAWVMKAVNS